MLGEQEQKAHQPLEDNVKYVFQELSRALARVEKIGYLDSVAADDWYLLRYCVVSDI